MRDTLESRPNGSELLEQATPRPWHGEVDPIFGADGSVVLRIAAHKNAAENAALAIKAVNAYEPLVKALRELLSFSYHYSGCESSYRVTTRCGCGHQEAREKAFAALAIVTESDSGTSVESSPEREGGE